MITQQELMEDLVYSPSTGVFIWAVSRGSVAKGKRAGWVGNEGYRYLRVRKRVYCEHRLAWLYVHGEWPLHQIDHVNRNPSDNRIDNLREASQSNNNCNKGLQRNNSSGYKGVSWNKRAKKWVACIYVEKVRLHIGRFDAKEDAVAARAAAAARLHGEFCTEAP